MSEDRGNTDYDRILDEYYRYKNTHILVKNSQKYSIRAAVGDLTGLDVIDFGCGFGYQGRWMKDWGAKSITGLDVSEAMLSKGRQLEEAPETRTGMKFLYGNIADGSDNALDELKLGPVDMIICFGVLNNVQNVFRNAHKLLKPGGRFTGYFEMPMPKDVCERYSVKTTFDPEKHPIGVSYQNSFIYEGGVFECDLMHFIPAKAEELARAVGFSTVQFRPPLITPEGLAEHGEEFWREFIDPEHPMYSYFTFVK